MQRPDKRQPDQLRNIRITPNFLPTADGSVLIECGKTRVICTAMLEEKVPPFLKGTGRGWITAEYGMLPASTQNRKPRDIGKSDGRGVEIQRLIGRSLRAIAILDNLGERTLTLDCDVIQADGGTRTASITGAYIAAALAMKKHLKSGLLKAPFLKGQVAAISVGIVDDEPLLDLCYAEDSSAQVDMNIVMTDKLEYIEIQGTGEARPFRQNEFESMLTLARKGIPELIALQNKAIEKGAGA